MKGEMMTEGEFGWVCDRLSGYRREAGDHLLRENYVRDVERLIKHVAFVEEQRDEARKLARGLWEYAEAHFEDQEIESDHPWLKEAGASEEKL